MGKRIVTVLITLAITISLAGCSSVGVASNKQMYKNTTIQSHKDKNTTKISKDDTRINKGTPKDIQKNKPNISKAS